MKFSKIGKHTIRCVISEQEIQDLGYTIEEIMSNGERTQEFMTIRWHLRFRSIRDRMK